MDSRLRDLALELEQYHEQKAERFLYRPQFGSLGVNCDLV